MIELRNIHFSYGGSTQGAPILQGMRRTRIAAIATAGALAAAGTGVALATSASDDAKQREQAVLEDAAGRLDVDAGELRDALAAAEDAQLDAEVKAGRITQEQADAIKQMRERTGLVLGGPGHRGGPDGSGFRGGPPKSRSNFGDVMVRPWQ